MICIAVYLVSFVVFIAISLIDSLLMRYHLISYDWKPLICQSILPNYVIIDKISSYPIKNLPELLDHWISFVFADP